MGNQPEQDSSLPKPAVPLAVPSGRKKHTFVSANGEFSSVFAVRSLRPVAITLSAFPRVNAPRLGLPRPGDASCGSRACSAVCPVGERHPPRHADWRVSHSVSWTQHPPHCHSDPRGGISRSVPRCWHRTQSARRTTDAGRISHRSGNVSAHPVIPGDTTRARSFAAAQDDQGGWQVLTGPGALDTPVSMTWVSGCWMRKWLPTRTAAAGDVSAALDMTPFHCDQLLCNALWATGQVSDLRIKPVCPDTFVRAGTRSTEAGLVQRSH